MVVSKKGAGNAFSALENCCDLLICMVKKPDVTNGWKAPFHLTFRFFAGWLCPCPPPTPQVLPDNMTPLEFMQDLFKDGAQGRARAPSVRI